jgi:hypothetical protein
MFIQSPVSLSFGEMYSHDMVAASTGTYLFRYSLTTNGVSGITYSLTAPGTIQLVQESGTAPQGIQTGSVSLVAGQALTIGVDMETSGTVTFSYWIQFWN